MSTETPSIDVHYCFITNPEENFSDHFSSRSVVFTDNDATFHVPVDVCTVTQQFTKSQVTTSFFSQCDQLQSLFKQKVQEKTGSCRSYKNFQRIDVEEIMTEIVSEVLGDYSDLVGRGSIILHKDYKPFYEVQTAGLQKMKALLQ